MANTLVTSGLGVLFWAQASRKYSASQVGQDAALLSAMMLLSSISQLNLSVGIPRLLPQVAHRRWRPVLTAYAVVAGVAVVTTVAFVALAPRASGQFSFLADNVVLASALVIAVVLWNVFALQDAVLTSARWAAAVPVENGVFGVLKIGLMIWLAGRLGEHGMFAAWLLAMALLVVPVNALLFGKVLRSGGGETPRTTVLPITQRRRVVRYLAGDYAAALVSQGSSGLLPLIVLGVLGRAANAYFYVAFLVVAAMSALSHSLSVSIVVEASHDEDALRSVARRSVARYALFVLPVVGILMVLAPLVLASFGSEYAANGTTLLRLLLAGTVPQAIVMLYLGVERVRAKVPRVFAVEAATLVLTSVGAVAGMRAFGLPGLGLAWLVSHTLVASFVVRPIWNVVGSRPRQPG